MRSAERNRFGEPEGGRTVRVAEHGRDRGNRLQFRNDRIVANVARVQDMADAGENSRDFRVKITVRVGDDANFHIIGGASYTSPEFQGNQGLL